MAESKTTKRRTRRSPEELLRELAKKSAKLENRLYKKHKEAVHTIGTAILKKAKFDFTNITEDVIKEIENGSEKGHKIIKEILEKAAQD